MANLNKVMIIGNLTKDPDIRDMPSGDPVANITLAVNRSWTDKSGEKKKDVTFISVVIWKKRAEVVQQYCKKGDPLFVEGRLQTRSWDGPDGKKMYKTEVIAENIQLMGGKKADSAAPKEGDVNWLPEEPGPDDVS